MGSARLWDLAGVDSKQTVFALHPGEPCTALAYIFDSTLSLEAHVTSITSAASRWSPPIWISVYLTFLAFHSSSSVNTIGSDSRW